MRHIRNLCRIPALLMLTLLLGMATAEASVKITEAKWSRAAGQLTVRGTSSALTPVDIYIRLQRSVAGQGESGGESEI